MIRKMVHIDEDKCNGCGLCITACHEGALKMVDGKARLASDVYCDGLGACLPDCPTGAITIIEREAAAFDEEAVKRHLDNMKGNQKSEVPWGCPGTHAKVIARKDEGVQPEVKSMVSQLGQWPCQIKLVPVNAPYFDGTDLLIAADCTAFAYANMHSDFMRGKITLIGCPKLDGVNYAEKLTEIIRNNNINSIKVVRMEVPCCGGLVQAVKQALYESGKVIPWQIVVIGTDGSIRQQ